jgi:hypothetical protein
LVRDESGAFLEVLPGRAVMLPSRCAREVDHRDGQPQVITSAYRLVRPRAMRHVAAASPMANDMMVANDGGQTGEQGRILSTLEPIVCSHRPWLRAFPS